MFREVMDKIIERVQKGDLRGTDTTITQISIFKVLTDIQSQLVEINESIKSLQSLKEDKDGRGKRSKW